MGEDRAEIELGIDVDGPGQMVEIRAIVSLALIEDLLKARRPTQKELERHGQQGMFTGGGPLTGKPQPRPELRPVMAHIRQTEHGPVLVGPHEGIRYVGPDEPVTIVPLPLQLQPEPQPEPIPLSEVLPDERAPVRFVEPEPVQPVVAAPLPVSVPEQEVTVLPVPAKDSPPKMAPLLDNTSQRATRKDTQPGPDLGITPTLPEVAPREPQEMPEGWRDPEPEAGYWYVPGDATKGEEAPLYVPPGAAESQTRMWRGQPVTAYRYDSPISTQDQSAARLRPVAPELDPSGAQVWAHRGTSSAEQGHLKDRPANTLFAVLDDNWERFESKIDKLSKKAARFKLDAPTVEVLGKGTVTVQVGEEEDLEGNPQPVFGRVPYRLVRVQGPKVQIPGGWQLRAKVTPLPGTDMTQVQAVGRTDSGAPLPTGLWHSMFCDHCNTARDRAVIYAFQDKKGAWKRVGSSCMKDFSGVTPEAIAYMAQFSDLAGEGESFGAISSRRNYASVDRILRLTMAAIEDDGGYVSSADAERYGIRSTSSRVRKEIARPGRIARMAAKPEHRLHAQAVSDWLQQLPAGTDEYRNNLRAYGQAGAVPLDGPGIGLIASAINAKHRDDAETAEAGRPVAGWFGKPDEKIGPQKGKKPNPAKDPQHKPRLVRVIRTMERMTDYGPQTLITMADDEGHRFKWWASGNPETIPVEVPGIGKVGGPVRPGDIVQLAGATIKKHEAWQPKTRDGAPKGEPVQETVINRATLRAVVSPEEVRDLHETHARWMADDRDMRARLTRMVDEFQAFKSSFKNGYRDQDAKNPAVRAVLEAANIDPDSHFSEVDKGPAYLEHQRADAANEIELGRGFVRTLAPEDLSALLDHLGVDDATTAAGSLWKLKHDNIAQTDNDFSAALAFRLGYRRKSQANKPVGSGEGYLGMV